MPEVFSAFIALVFTGKVFCQSSPVPVLRAESGEMKYYSWQKQIYLKSIISKHMGLGKMHPKVLANVIVSLFSIIFERSWRLLMTWKKVNVTCIFKNGKKEKLGKWQVILTPVLERLWSKSSLKTAQMHSDTCRTRGWLGTASTGKKKEIILDIPDCLLWWEDKKRAVVVKHLDLAQSLAICSVVSL